VGIAHPTAELLKNLVGIAHPTEDFCGDKDVMQLVIFDVDGTLTNTYQVDEDCFVQEFQSFI
jgi:hypothetical protein